MIDVAGLTLSGEEVARLRDPRIGGVILFARNYASVGQVRELVAAIQAVRAPKLLVAVDQEGGRVQRFRDGFSKLPPARWLGRQYDADAERARELAHACGWLMAAELLDVGIDLSFAPVVDLDLGFSEVIGDRAFHQDAEVVANLASAYVQGMRKAGMRAVAKHFPGHGAVVADSHHELPHDPRELAAMDGDLLPYRRLIANGLSGVMMAHVKFPAIDRRIASLSPYWVQTELRRKLGFSGAIFSDDLSMSAADIAGDIAERVRQALDAGADMVLICNDANAVTQVLEVLDDLGNPASQARLVAIRPHSIEWVAGQLHETDGWQSVIARLAAADAPPSLVLDG